MIKLEPVDIREIDEESMRFTINLHDSIDMDENDYQDFKMNINNDIRKQSLK